MDNSLDLKHREFFIKLRALCAEYEASINEVNRDGMIGFHFGRKLHAFYLYTRGFDQVTDKVEIHGNEVDI